MEAQLDITGAIRTREFSKGPARHWLIPPEVYGALNEEFHFNFDPFPYPRPSGWNALKMDWGSVNFVNPPFIREGRIGITAYVRKAIEENKKGKMVVLTLPIHGYFNLLMEAGAEMRSMGRVRWLEVQSRKPMQAAVNTACVVLKG